MALSEGSWTAETASQAVTKRWSRGDQHSQHIKKALQGKRLAGKHVRPAIDRLALALKSESDAVAVRAAELLLDRALGKAAMAPEDAQIVSDALQLQPSAVLPMLAQMLPAALQQRTIDVTPLVTDGSSDGIEQATTK